MGACLSCLGIRQGNNGSDAERRGLLYDDPYSQSHQGHNYGSWSQAPSIPPQNLMSPEEVRREQQALNSITRWASDQIVEIFPHRNALANINMGGGGGGGGGAGNVSTHFNGNGNGNGGEGTNGNGGSGMLGSAAHQDILLNMIPGDKNKRSIRIYPASRPGSSLSRDGGRATSIKSKESSSRLNARSSEGNRSSKVFVKLNVELS